jgi:hypothetical protein
MERLGTVTAGAESAAGFPCSREVNPCQALVVQEHEVFLKLNIQFDTTCDIVGILLFNKRRAGKIQHHYTKMINTSRFWNRTVFEGSDEHVAQRLRHAQLRNPIKFYYVSNFA